MKRLVALGGALGILVLAWWFDRLYDLSRLEAAKTFDPNPVIWVAAVMHLVLAGLVLLLAWFAILRNGASTPVFLVFLLVGLLSIISFFLQAPLSLLPPSLSQPLSAFLSAAPRSLLYQASAFTAMIGLIGLVARRRPSL